MTHDDASVETGVGGQAKYDMMMVSCGNALQQLSQDIHWFLINGPSVPSTAITF